MTFTAAEELISIFHSSFLMAQAAILSRIEGVGLAESPATRKAVEKVHSCA